MVYDDFLSHYGILGQKWGVRRFQNKDGSRTAAGKVRYSNSIDKKVKERNEIFNTLSEKEKKFLTGESSEPYASREMYGKNGTNVYSFVSKKLDTPISFLDVFNNDGTSGEVAIAVRSDYRNLGEGKKQVERLLKWFGNSSLDELLWISDPNNTSSTNLAKSYGFKEYEKGKYSYRKD